MSSIRLSSQLAFAATINIFSLIFFQSYSFGQTEKSKEFDTRVVCSTLPFQTTDYQLIPHGNDVYVQWNHVNGVEYMPIHEGIVVPNDLGFLTERAELLKKFGNEMKFRFQKSDCTFASDKVVKCANYQAKSEEIAGHKIALLSTYTSIESKTTFTGVYESVLATLFFRIDDKRIFVTMKYPLTDCFFGK